MKIITDRKKGVLYFEERPEVCLRGSELQTPYGACAAWERLRAEGVDDVSIKGLFVQVKFVEQTLSNLARHKVASVAAEQMNHLGEDTAWAVIDTVAREAHSPSAAASWIIGQMEKNGLSETEIGDRFVARFREG